jgi:hypothetical protein
MATTTISAHQGMATAGAATALKAVTVRPAITGQAMEPTALRAINLWRRHRGGAISASRDSLQRDEARVELMLHSFPPAAAAKHLKVVHARVIDERPRDYGRVAKMCASV